MILATHGILASSGGAFLLDNYPNAAAAYSLRKLRSAYTGNAIRVRRSSDNAEQNIGFTQLGNLDTSALTTFCSGTNGFVTTWYDQSGNGRNVVQTTATNQPQIVSSGNMILTNSKPSLQFDGSNDGFSEIITTNSETPLAIISVQKSNKSTGVQAIFRYGSLTPVIHRFDNSVYRIVAGSPAASLFSETTCTVTNQLLLESYLTSTTVNQYVNGVAGNSDTGTNAAVSGNIQIGLTLGFTEFYLGNIQEIILYGITQTSNRLGIESNINTYYGIY
jgi:hypothetical protein